MIGSMRRAVTAVCVTATTGALGLAGAGAARAEGDRPVEWNAVVMGDSFGSGEGADDDQFIPPSAVWRRDWYGSRGCHQSWSAWGMGLAQAYADAGRISQVKIAACSGSLLPDIVHSHKNSAGETTDPQIRAVNDHTRLVTLSLGGNDNGFADILAACVDHLPKSFGIGCTTDGRVERIQAAARKNTGFDKYSLAGSYLAVANNMAPDGTIVVATYPRLFASTIASYVWHPGVRLRPYPTFSCKVGTALGALNVEIGYRDAQNLNKKVDVVDQEIRDAVEIARTQTDRKIVISETSPAFTDHRICSGSRWFRGAEINLGNKITTLQGFQVPDRKQTSFHPTEKGQEAYCRQAFAALHASEKGLGLNNFKCKYDPKSHDWV